MQSIDEHMSFGGIQRRYAHHAETLACDMRFSVFLPPRYGAESPVLFWLSGLTCTDENFVQKAGAQRCAAELGVVLIAPDTSPRGSDVADDDAYDLGQGAGFYLNANQSPWAPNYRMEDYIVRELPDLLAQELGIRGPRGISGHSMGGHGALTLAMKHPQVFASVSALAPIVAPTQVPWGQKAFAAYIGTNESEWQEHDACHLVSARGFAGELLVDQGTDDPFYTEQLRTWLLEDACKRAEQPAVIRTHEGYDHSYFFVATFIDEHIRHHVMELGIR